MKLLRRFVAIPVLAVLFLAGAPQVGAQETVQPYRSYTVDSVGRRIPIPDPYVLDHVIDGLALGVGELATPRDIFVARDTGHLYIADTDNGRILELDERDRVVRNLGAELKLNRPQGIFRDQRDGTLWIADTGNDRILQTTAEGDLLQEFSTPRTDVLAEINPAAAAKVLVDKRGYIYLLEGTGAGMIVMDQENQFRGFFGTNRLEFSLNWLWARYLATEEQRAKLLLAKPTAHTDMYLGSDGFTYTAVASASSHQIQKLSPVAVNVFVDKSLERKLYRSQVFGEERRSWQTPARLAAVAVDAAGIVTTLDATVGRIYQYDQDRNLLLAFGKLGIGRLEFAVPVEVEVDQHGRLYVLDSGRSVIYVLQRTEFAELIHKASGLQLDGLYAEAAATWQQVLDLAASYELAHSGIGSALYHQRRWDAAMQEHVLGRDQLGYSRAFYEHRQEYLRRNMGWFVSAIFVAMAGVLAWPGLTRGRPRGQAFRKGRGGGRELPAFLGILLRPAETFEKVAIGRSLWPAVLLVAIAAAVRLISLALIAFHMRATPAAGSFLDWVIYRPVAAYLLPELRWEDANLWVEMLRIVGPWFLWSVANYGISALFDGKGTFVAVARTTAYCLVPYILFAVPIALLSHGLTGQERGLYEAMWSLVYYWVLFLLVLEIRWVNDYTIRQTIGVGLIMVFGLAVLAGVMVLFGLLVREAVGFVGEVLFELVRLLL